jgi:hypothetical protein
MDRRKSHHHGLATFPVDGFAVPQISPTKLFWSTAAFALLYQLPKKSFRAADVSAGFSSISQWPERNFIALTWSDISAA